MLKESLSDRLARDIRGLIRRGDLRVGDRLPTILEMARRFGVGHPTVREALARLETIGMVEIRHGAGVYVARSEERLVLAGPAFAGAVTPKLLLDLIRTRLPLETQAAAEAAARATAGQLAGRLRAVSGDNISNVGAGLGVEFHRQIAEASGNIVLAQVLDVLLSLYAAEQQRMLATLGRCRPEDPEHLGILEAIERHDVAIAAQRMRAHLEHLERAVRQWAAEHHPDA